jgi:hypothetical protein
MRKRLANALLFQLGWFACVMGGDGPWLLLGATVLVIHLLWIGTWAEEGRLLISVALLGTVLDSFLHWLGVFEFQQVTLLIPFWLMLLWALLATTLRHCLAWSARPWWLAAALGAVGGPLSYYAGGQLAGVHFPYGTWPTLVGLGVLWGLVFPGLHALARYAEAGTPLPDNP